MSRVTIVALAWALLHFLWQGAAIALAAGLATAALRRARPASRYAVLCAALGAMLLAPAVTVFVLRHPQSAVSAPFDWLRTARAAAAPVAPLLSPVSLPAMPSAEGSPWFAWIVGIWLTGVAILGARSLVGWVWAQRLKTWRTTPAAPRIHRAAIALGERLGIRRAVRILSTAAAEVPTTIGWLRPVVLLPVSALTSLTPEQIELLIAHELAHVRRHDYLVNLVQTAVETVLFYHPAVWWVSRRIRVERENCCDDLAVAACGDVVLYVEALAALEGIRARRSSMVLAADGGSLLHRIRRLIDRESTERQAPPAWLGAFAPAAVILAAVFAATPPRAVRTRPLPSSTPPQAVATPPQEEGTSPQAEATSTEAVATRPQAVATPPQEQTTPDQAVATPTEAVATPPQATAGRPSQKPKGEAVGFLGQLTESGYPKLSVDEMIALKEHGVEPRYVKDMLAAGLGVPSVEEVIRLRDHGVEPAFVAGIAASGLVSDLDFANVIDLRANDARGDDMGRIRALGFGPFPASEVIRLRQHGAEAASFAALKEAGAVRAGAADAIAFREYDVTVDRIRDMKQQGFNNLSVEQILKLRRSGVI